jgi:hypothetical protein
MAIEQDQAEADAAFAAGYDDKPTETPAAVKPEAAAKEDPKPAEVKAEPAKEEPVAEPTLQDVLARLDKFEQGHGKFQQTHDKLAGHIGRLERSYREIESKMATGQAAAKTVDDAPTQAAIKAASDDPQEWSTLKSQYPEWAAATEKMVAARAPSFDANAFEAKVNAAIDGKTAEMQSRIIDSSLNAVFPGWRTEVAAPAFAAWMATQADDVKTLSASADIGDAARMLKLYEASKAAPAPAADQQAAAKEPSPREKRLAAAVNPKGTGGHAPGRTELDEFEAGYNG